MNVGFWQGNTYVKIHTPEVVAYHDNNEQLYLAPNLRMCTRTKDIHFLCPSKPFVFDNTEGICGLESIRPDTSCPAKAKPRSQVEVTQAEIIGNRWLVNTPARTATLTYDQHDTATRIILPNQTLWITVPKGSILHIDELALYHLTDDEYQAEIEISPFFKQHSFVLDPELEERIKEEGMQLVDLTPVDTALEIIARQVPNQFLPKLPCTRIQSVMEMLFVSCVCLFSLLLVPMPADVRNGNLTEQRGMCNALGERGSTHTKCNSTFLRLKELLSSLSASRKIDK